MESHPPMMANAGTGSKVVAVRFFNVPIHS